MTHRELIHKWNTLNADRQRYIYHAANDTDDDLLQLDGMTCFLQLVEKHYFNKTWFFVLVVFPFFDQYIKVSSHRMSIDDLEKI